MSALPQENNGQASYEASDLIETLQAQREQALNQAAELNSLLVAREREIARLQNQLDEFLKQDKTEESE